MEADASVAREARAARNQALFRVVNEKMLELNTALSSMTETFVIACECADTGCTQMLTISPEQYAAVRREPRHFAVLRGHVLPEVEDVVGESGEYVVVEKRGEAGVVAEQTARLDEQSAT